MMIITYQNIILNKILKYKKQFQKILNINLKIQIFRQMKSNNLQITIQNSLTKSQKKKIKNKIMEKTSHTFKKESNNLKKRLQCTNKQFKIFNKILIKLNQKIIFTIFINYTKILQKQAFILKLLKMIQFQIENILKMNIEFISKRNIMRLEII